MSGDPSDRLEALLRQWDERQRLGDTQSDRLRSQIVQSLQQGRAHPPESVVVCRPTATRRLAAACLVLAVALSVIVFSWQSQPQNTGTARTETRDGLPPGYVWLQESQLRDKIRLLREMESMFDGQVEWLLETGNAVRIGLAKEIPHGHAQPVTVRVVAERRPVGQTDWTIVWAADVVARSEEVVRLKPDSQSGAEFAMWTYVLPDGMISIDVELTLQESAVLKVTTSGLQEDRKPVEVYSTNTGAFEFRLFQTAAVLNEPVI